MKYDDASWHFDTTPEGPDEERWANAAAHIGIYLKWCITKGLASTGDEHRDAFESVKSGRRTGTQFLMHECDGKFTDEELSAEGNDFTAVYYEELYLADLDSLVG